MPSAPSEPAEPSGENKRLVIVIDDPSSSIITVASAEIEKYRVDGELLRMRYNTYMNQITTQ